MSTSISLEIHLAKGDFGHTKIRKGKKPKHAKMSAVPRIAKLMALAIKYDQLLQSGAVAGQNALAQLAGVDRSHISKLIRLRLLSPKIQEELLSSEFPSKSVDWEKMDELVRFSNWVDQEVAFRELKI